MKTHAPRHLWIRTWEITWVQPRAGRTCYHVCPECLREWTHAKTLTDLCVRAYHAICAECGAALAVGPGVTA